jgi:hypothetical protein
MRKILGPLRDNFTGWRKLLNEEFHALYASDGIIGVVM